MMRVPGSNVLKKAFNAVARDTLWYYQANGTTITSIGQRLTDYLPGVQVRGSFQPVEKNKYNHIGLDLQKSYFYLYISRNFIDLTRDIAADQLGFQGQRFQIQSTTDWYNVDGWLQILCVAIGRDTALQNIFGFNDLNANNGQTNFSGGNFAPDADTELNPDVG